MMLKNKIQRYTDLYIKTNKEVYIKKIFKLMNGLIHRKINSKGMYYYREDVYQEICEDIWKSLKYYKSESSSAMYYLSTVIDRSIVSHIKYLTMKIRDSDNESYSLNDLLYEDDMGKSFEMLSRFEDNRSAEESAIYNIEFNRLVDSFVERLTDMEKKIFITYLETDGKFYKTKNITILKNFTGYKKKQIDNAFRRIKKKGREFFKDVI